MDFNIKNVFIETSDEIENIKLNFEMRGEGIFVEKEFKVELVVKIENGWCIDVIRQGNINSPKISDKVLNDLFRDAYNEKVKNYYESLSDGVEVEDVETIDPQIIVPYDPNSIRVSQGRFSLKEIYEMLTGTNEEEVILDLSPDFQRHYVWDSTRKSRLIESILLRIPLPVFYFARDNEGKYQVVDGVQRLSVIKEFFSNGFKLRNLEYLGKDCDLRYFNKVGANIDSLHPKFVRQLRAYQVDCNIIEPDTPHKVKLDIFKRLNTGGRSLNNQEIRNSILKKEARNFIRDLAQSDSFINATDHGINSKRMVDQEIVIRFIGFFLIYIEKDVFPDLTYNGKMDYFLDEVVRLLNTEYRRIPFNQLKEGFINSMNNAIIMFGQFAFRKISLKNENKNMINKSLFVAFSVLLSKYENNIIRKKGLVFKELAKKLDTDKYLFDAVTYATNDKSRVDTTFLKIEEFLDELYGGVEC